MMALFWLICVSLVLGMAAGFLVYGKELAARWLKLERAVAPVRRPGWQSEWTVQAAHEAGDLPPPRMLPPSSPPGRAGLR